MMNLSLDQLTVRLTDALTIGPVSGVFHPGVHVILGPNGCGKTTILRMICGVVRPSSGAVLIDGGDPWADPRLRRHIGFMSAEPMLLDNMTVHEAVSFSAAMRREPSWDPRPLLERFDLSPHLRLEHASAGQRRRAELIASLAADPPVLLLDEVFTYLDASALAEISALIQELRDERVILMTSHTELSIEPDSISQMRSNAALDFGECIRQSVPTRIEE